MKKNCIVNCERITEGQVFANYKELCEALGEDVKSGTSRIKQMANWDRYFLRRKIDGTNRILIEKIYDTPLGPSGNEASSKYYPGFEKVILLRMYLDFVLSPSMDKIQSIDNQGTFTVPISRKDLYTKSGIATCIWAEHSKDIDNFSVMLRKEGVLETKSPLIDHLHLDNWSEKNKSQIQQVYAHNEDNNIPCDVKIPDIFAPEKAFVQIAVSVFRDICERSLKKMAKSETDPRRKYLVSCELHGLTICYQEQEGERYKTRLATKEEEKTLKCIKEDVLTRLKYANENSLYSNGTSTEIKAFFLGVKQRAKKEFKDFIYCGSYDRIYLSFNMNPLKHRLSELFPEDVLASKSNCIQALEEERNALNKVVVDSLYTSLVHAAYIHMLIEYGKKDNLSKTARIRHASVRKAVNELIFASEGITDDLLSKSSTADNPQLKANIVIAEYLRRMLIMSAKMCYLSKDEAEMLLMKYSNEERDMLMTIVNGYQGKERVDLCEQPHYGTPIDDKLWAALMAPEENTDAIANVEENVEAGDEADLCLENDDTNIDFENEDFLLDGLVEYI